MSPSPWVVAGKPSVITSTRFKALPASVMQLTPARNSAASLVPRRLIGTDGSSAKTRPRTAIVT